LLGVATPAAAQEFQILRAEYGYGDRWADVTERLRELARVDATFRAGNESFGVDPAPGRTKMLRIHARGSRGESRTFEYREGSMIDGSNFSGWRTGNWGSVPGSATFTGRYQILRADYGFTNRQVDVTQRVRELARGNARFRADNDAFGIDPAPGSGKTLRIYARDPRGETQTLEYREGSIVDGGQFADWNDGGGGAGRAVTQPLQIISAVYGAGNRNIDVAARLQALARNGRLTLTVNNAAFNTDPAPNVKKTLWISYSVGGGPRREIVIQEGDRVNIP
jgi:hypothetical protein